MWIMFFVFMHVIYTSLALKLKNTSTTKNKSDFAFHTITNGWGLSPPTKKKQLEPGLMVMG